MLRSAKLARPLALVATVVVPVMASERPAAGLSVSVTATPACATLFPVLSVSCTVTGGAMTAPAAAPEGCCTKARWLAEPATLVKSKTAGAAVPGALAVTSNEPTWVLAVTEIAATPPMPVVTVAGPENVTLAPLDGAAKVTTTPGTPLPSASCTLAFSWLA